MLFVEASEVPYISRAISNRNSVGRKISPVVMVRRAATSTIVIEGMDAYSVDEALRKVILEGNPRIFLANGLSQQKAAENLWFF